MFKVGDKVKCVSTVYDLMDKTGTLVVINERFYPNIGVGFDEWVEGHDPEGCCRWLGEDDLVILEGEADDC